VGREEQVAREYLRRNSKEVAFEDLVTRAVGLRIRKNGEIIRSWSGSSYGSGERRESPCVSGEDSNMNKGGERRRYFRYGALGIKFRI